MKRLVLIDQKRRRGRPRGATLAVGDNLTPLGPHEKVRATKLSRMIAARIRLVREVRGWSQPEFEEKLGGSPGTASRIESGTRGRSLSIDTVCAAATALRIDLLWLITGHGRNPFGATKIDAESQQALPFELIETHSKRKKLPPK